MLGLRVQAAVAGGGGGRYGEYLCFCRRRRHILITFVGMTLLIVSYGVNTVQMSAEPSWNKVVSTVNNSGIHDDGHARNRAVIINGSSTVPNGNLHLLQIATLPTPEAAPVGHDYDGDGVGVGGYGSQKDLLGRFINLRKSRLFGLLGTNFSLAYNLTIGNSNTVANITVAPAPAPTYYYAPAPYYPYAYGYSNPYAYNPYAYNPYAYNPYANPYGSYYYR